MKTLVSVSVSGIGDRIRLLLAARGLAKELGSEFLHVWPVNGHCGAEFNDLFTCKEPIVTPKDPWPDRCVWNFRQRKWPDVVDVITRAAAKHELIKFHCYRAPFDQHDFGTVVKFAPEIELEANLFAEKHGIGRIAIGCHVRRGDYAWKTPSLQDYFRAVDVLTTLPDQPIYLATDDHWVRSAFKDTFGKRLVNYPVTSFSRGDHQATIESAIELAILRKCGSLALSGWSEFSRLACLHEPPSLSDSVVTVVNNT